MIFYMSCLLSQLLVSAIQNASILLTMTRCPSQLTLGHLADADYTFAGLIFWNR